MLSTYQPKSMAKMLRQAFDDRGVEISHSACLEIVAQQLGYADWNTLRAAQKSESAGSLTLLVEHGREREAVSFYRAAFNALVIELYHVEGALAGADLLIWKYPFTVAGSNPNRERQPDRGGPFFPKEPGDVRAMYNIRTNDIDQIVAQALAAGATVRQEVQSTDGGTRAGSVFDPFGHIWTFQQV